MAKRIQGIDSNRCPESFLLLALFDRELETRRKILRPILAELSDFKSKDTDWYRRMADRKIVFAALALSMPEEFVQWQKGFRESIPIGAQLYLPYPWEVGGHCLAKRDVELLNYVVVELENDWVIGQKVD